MSPFATWLTSWARTASASSRVMLCSSPVLTATSDASRRAPVAKAFGSGESKMPTSGIPMPASRACRCTVPTSQLSVALPGWPITRTPIIRFAVHFEMASETNEPVKPTTAANASSLPRSRSTPRASSTLSSPSRRSTKPSSTMMARLVARNSRTRFMNQVLRVGLSVALRVVGPLPRDSSPAAPAARGRRTVTRSERPSPRFRVVRRT